MRHYIFAFVAATSLLAACKKDHDNTPGALAGTWTEQERAPQFGGSNYKVLLTSAGRFDMSIRIFTDVVTSNPCLERTDYISGNWHVSGNKLVFAGYYTDSTFIYNQPNACNGTLDYADTFSYQLYRADVMILDPQLDDYQSVYLVRQ